MDRPGGFVKLKQFLMWRGLAPTAMQADRLIKSGAVRVNGRREQRRTYRLLHGDTVFVGRETFVVDLSRPYRFIRLDHFLHAQGIYKVAPLVRSRAVCVNDEVELKAKRRLYEGDVVTVSDPLTPGEHATGVRTFKVDLGRLDEQDDEDQNTS